MLKHLAILFILLAVTLSACQSPGISATTETAFQTTAAQEGEPESTLAPSPPPASLAGGAVPGCSVVSSQLAVEQSLYPQVTDEDRVKGPDTAAITFIVYSDFQCPACASIAPVLAQLQSDYPEQVRLVYRHFPLINIHDKAALATQAGEAAGAQGSFWEMHDLLFARQADWTDLTLEEFPDWLVERAAELGLDVDQFRADLLNQTNVELVQDAWDTGVALEVPWTPFLIINGGGYDGPRDYYSLEVIVKATELEDRQFTVCPPMTIDRTRQYIATLQTEKGDIVLELYADAAPLAVNSFIFLAQNGWFDGVTFHRVVPGFVAQAGDPSGTGLGNPGYAFDNEISSSLNFDQAGVLGMANAGPNSNGSQFFITLGPAPHLAGGYTIFGQVIDGLDVVENLTPRNPAEDPTLPPGDAILSVVIEEK